MLSARNSNALLLSYVCIKFIFHHCRKKMRSTSQYIYDTLFINGENSDVKIIACGREWKLHKVYLCQVIFSFDRSVYINECMKFKKCRCPVAALCALYI